jgi:hypothetical protein
MRERRERTERTRVAILETVCEARDEAARVGEEILEVELPEGPADVERGGEAVSVGRRAGGPLEGIRPEPGESPAGTMRRVQRARNGAGAVYVIRLDAPSDPAGGGRHDR